jgi:hypothetical protein
MYATSFLRRQVARQVAALFSKLCHLKAKRVIEFAILTEKRGNEIKALKVKRQW